MDEIEQRLGALELLTIEALARLPATTRAELAAALAPGPGGPLDPDEATIRAQAARLVAEAAWRFKTFTGGGETA